MPTGSCLCGEIKIAYTGSPAYSAICYCHDDRKINNFTVYQVPKKNFSVTQGEPKIYTKTSDHSNEINNHFCATCGTTLFRTGGEPAMKDNVGLRAGVLDDQSILDKPPAIEVYVERRPRVSKPPSLALSVPASIGHESGFCAGPPAGFIPFFSWSTYHEVRQYYC